MLYNEITETKKLVTALLQKQVEYSIEEISLSKAATLLRLGIDSVLSLVNKGEIKVRKYRDSKRKVRYRFRLADIHEFQERRSVVPVNYITHPEIETADEIGRRIFNLKKRSIG